MSDNTPVDQAEQAQAEADEAATEAVEEVIEQAEDAAEAVEEIIEEAREEVEEAIEAEAETIAQSTGFDPEMVRALIREELDARNPDPTPDPPAAAVVTETTVTEVVPDTEPVEADTVPVPQHWFTRPLFGRNR